MTLSIPRSKFMSVREAAFLFTAVVPSSSENDEKKPGHQVQSTSHFKALPPLGVPISSRKKEAGSIFFECPSKSGLLTI